MLSIILVEDDPALAHHLKAALTLLGEMEVLAVFPSGEEALGSDLCGQAQVMLVDLALPGISGVELIRELHARIPDLNLLVFTIKEDQQNVFEALQAGASGYLLKGCPVMDLRAAIRSAAAGESPMSPGIARRLLEQYRQRQVETLSPREETIVRLLAEGCTYKEVAARLGVSTHTVHSHIKKIYQKLDVSSRSLAVQKARQLGYTRS